MTTRCCCCSVARPPLAQHSTRQSHRDSASGAVLPNNLHVPLTLFLLLIACIQPVGGVQGPAAQVRLSQVLQLTWQPSRGTQGGIFAQCIRLVQACSMAAVQEHYVSCIAQLQLLMQHVHMHNEGSRQSRLAHGTRAEHGVEPPAQLSAPAVLDAVRAACLHGVP